LGAERLVHFDRMRHVNYPLSVYDLFTRSYAVENLSHTDTLAHVTIHVNMRCVEAIVEVNNERFRGVEPVEVLSLSPPPPPRPLNTFNSAILLIVYINNPFNTFDADKGIS